MIFDTQVSGVSCSCEVLEYHPRRPMLFTGTGFGDVLPPEEEVFNFQLLDSEGKHAPWLEHQLTQDDMDRLLIEAKTGAHHDNSPI